MYVRVHKKGNQWFRENNGTLVGTEIHKSTYLYKNLINRIGKPVIIIRNTNNEIKMIYYGYFNNNEFIRLQASENCSDKTCGYYAFVLG